jgi:hypothetical protein
MESCHDYLGCNRHDCVMQHTASTLPCWRVAGTRCNHHGIDIARHRYGEDKETACRLAACIYYRVANPAARSPGSTRGTGRFL